MPDAETETEAWMSQIGTQFVNVRFWLPKATGWFDERHVADPETLHTTIDMSASRIGARSAVWQHPGEDGWRYWRFSSGPSDEPHKTFPNKEAAEMYAIHRG